MTHYLKTIVTVVVGVSAIMVLLPKDGFSKYVNLLSGILVMAVVIMPVFNFEFEIDEKFFACYEHTLVHEGKLKARIELEKKD